MSRKYLFTRGYVATLEYLLGGFSRGAVVVENGVMKVVAKEDDHVTIDTEIINITEGVVMPGMVNTRLHASMSLTRGWPFCSSFLVLFAVLYYHEWALKAEIGSWLGFDFGTPRLCTNISSLSCLYIYTRKCV